MEQENIQPAPENSEAAPEYDFESVYANNAYFESSVWDLKIIFGQLEQHTGKTLVDWHTAVTIPWLQAKIWSYYLRLNVAIHEATSGPLTIPARVLPPPPEPPSADLPEDSAEQRTYRMAKKWYDEIFG
jgi:hypothetical protein